MAVMRAVGNGHQLPAHANGARGGARVRDRARRLRLHGERARRRGCSARASRCAATSSQTQRTTERRSACTSGSRSRSGFPTTPTPTGSRSSTSTARSRSTRRGRGSSLATVPIEHRSPLRRSTPTRSPAEKGGEMAIATPTIRTRRTASKPRLKRSMGLWMATALVVGNMVGSGIFTLPAVLAGEAGPASIVALAFTGHRRDAAGARLRQPRPRAPAHRRALLLRPARVRRLRRLPDRLGLLDRRLGRQRRDRRRVRRLPRRLLGRREHEQLARRARRRRRGLAVHAGEHPRRPRDRASPRW